MKTSKCLMGILLSSVLLIGSVFAGNALSQDVKDGIINKGQISIYNNVRSVGEYDGNSNRDCTDCEFDWTAYGSECCDSAWDEFGVDCMTLEGTYGWDCSGCNCPLDGDAPEGCADGQYECADGGCIPGSYYCDGSAENGNAGWGPDCADGSDEVLAECCDNGSYDDATCGSGGDDCVDTDNGATDTYGDGCAGYTAYPSWCNGYDDDDFVSSEMCCACGGGSTGGGRDDDVSAKPMIYDDAPAKKMLIHIYDLRMAEYDAANASRDSACDGSWLDLILAVTAYASVVL